MVKAVHRNEKVRKTGRKIRKKPTGKAPSKAVRSVQAKPVKKRIKKNAHTGIIAGLFATDRKRGYMDYSFLLLVGVLSAFGLIMLLSASTAAANVKFGNSYRFFLRQFGYVAVGTVLMLIISRIDYRKYKPYAKLFMIICIIMLALVFVPGIGVDHNGSRRWINLVVMEFQPSEITKLAVAMFFAAMIEDKKYDIATLDGMIRLGMWIGVVAILMMLETHLSGTIVLCGIALCIMIVGGMIKLRYVFMGGGAAAVLAVLFLSFDSVRRARVMTFMHPFTDRQGNGYQVIQSLYALGSGGIFGKGLGQSMQKFYLPEPYNDFIFAIVGEEIGLVGCTFIILLFAGLILRGIKIALEAPDTFGSLMVVGIMAQVAIQTILNIAVVTSSIPNTGVPLPFFSYGGTAFMILLMEMGVVLSVSRFSVKNK